MARRAHKGTIRWDTLCCQTRRIINREKRRRLQEKPSALARIKSEEDSRRQTRLGLGESLKLTIIEYGDFGNIAAMYAKEDEYQRIGMNFKFAWRKF